MNFKYILPISIALAFLFQSCLLEEPEDPLAPSGGSSSTGVDFSASTTNIEPGETVYFTNNSSSTYEYFYWEFGNGNYSYNTNPSNTYYEVGSYDVSLYAYSETDEQVETKYGYITVESGSSGNFTGYAWNLWDGNVDPGPVVINDGIISGITTDSDEFMTGGDWAEGNWYVSQFNTNYLYRVSTSSGAKTYIGVMGLSSVTGLAYDVTTNTMYVSDFVDGITYLYTVNLNNAAVSYVGQIVEGLMIGIACNRDGDLYGINTTDDNLYYINKNNGSSYQIGNLGVNINYAQDIAFDRNTGILWGALYIDAGAKDSDKASAARGKGVYSGIYQINLDYGSATEIFDTEYEMAALAIPHNY